MLKRKFSLNGTLVGPDGGLSMGILNGKSGLQGLDLPESHKSVPERDLFMFMYSSCKKL